MARRQLDQYFTPEPYLRWLRDFTDDSLWDHYFEPCVGDGAIVSALCDDGESKFSTNDIDLSLKSDTHLDATSDEYWDTVRERNGNSGRNLIISNPPYKLAHKIVPNAVATGIDTFMLLRLTFLEPCKNRYDFLKENPPTHLFVMPRVSFTANRKTDTVTCAWFYWGEEFLNTPPVDFWRHDS
jgi:hypothetical protein